MNEMMQLRLLEAIETFIGICDRIVRKLEPILDEALDQIRREK